jgi:hypothetical protein
MKNCIDKISGSAVPVAQVASKPRVNRRNRTESAVFLRPQYERTVGWGWLYNTLWGNPSAVPVHGFEPPGTFESAKFEKNRRHTMQDTSQAFYADTHPHDLISRAHDKLRLFNNLLLQDNGNLALNNPIMQNGVYWLLDSIAHELDHAVNILMSKEGKQSCKN